MLCAFEEILRPHAKDIALASILPAADRLQDGPDSTRITNADYRILLCCLLPICLLLWPFRKFAVSRWLVTHLPYASELKNCHVLVDLSGVAFVDGRGISLLAYNVAVVLPALFLDVPVYKLAQALGPFNRPGNRFIARWILRRCRLVVSRGQTSYDNLLSLGLENIDVRQDTSFALSVSEQKREEAKRELEKWFVLEDPDAPLVLMSLSQVVMKYCSKLGLDFTGEIEKLILHLDSTGFQVGLLPHSSDTGIRKNNDWQLAEEVSDRLRQRQVKVPVLSPDGDPRLARAMISQARVFVACRFHSLIAALSQSVPVLTIGWSHKYREAARPFGMEEYTLDYSALGSSRMFELVAELADRRDELSKQMNSRAIEAKANAIDGILKVLDEE